MEMAERQKQVYPQSPKYMQIQISYKAKAIPDFDKLYSSFQDQLNRKKQQMRITEPLPEPLNFQQSHKGVDRPYLDREMKSIQSNKIKLKKLKKNEYQTNQINTFQQEMGKQLLIFEKRENQES
ncbi:unnamed protein product [Paramecium primaurelia]|uniref:Uncharacterized protein n=1 Tax=Paramecium primaurelia TaxID=5886 RepID=A0A8S1M7K4_PARPR|nr:unnamed protein product [Paramecium primaurelia]